MAHCKVCTHPQRALIESELSSATSTNDTGAKWGISGRAMRRHRQEHMTQEQIASYRRVLLPVHEADVDRVIKTGGQTAVVALGEIMNELIEATRKCDARDAFREAATNRQLQLKIIKEQAAMAMLYPSAKRAVHNTLVLANGADIFDTFGKILANSPTIEAARQAFAATLADSAREAMANADRPLARVEAPKPVHQIAAEIMDAEFEEVGEESED